MIRKGYFFTEHGYCITEVSYFNRSWFDQYHLDNEQRFKANNDGYWARRPPRKKKVKR